MIRRTAALAAFAALVVVPYMGSPLADAYASHLPTRPCASDDGPGPCYWNAAERGNGKGMSFWILRDGRRAYVATPTR